MAQAPAQVTVTPDVELFLIDTYVPALAALQQVQSVLQDMALEQQPLMLAFVQGWTAAMQTTIPNGSDTIIRQVNGATIDTESNIYSNAQAMLQFLQMAETLGLLPEGTVL